MLRSSSVFRRLLVCWVLVGSPVRSEDSATGPWPSPFEDTSLAAWTMLDGKPVGEGWEMVDGVIHLARRGPRVGAIMTAEEFGDFDLSFEWRISPRGNSGIKYRVRMYEGRWLGCEYQMYDDDRVTKSGSKGNPKHLSGALYDLYPPNDAKKLLPVGEYNTGRIVVRGDQVEHWLNGLRIVSAVIGDADWERRIKASKFSDTPDFARNARGRLMLTDHDGDVWLRNVRFTTP
jgi:hypothetical protein